MIKAKLPKKSKFWRNVTIIVGVVIFTTILAVVIIITRPPNKDNAAIIDKYQDCGCGACGGIDLDIETVYLHRSSDGEQELQQRRQDGQNRLSSPLCHAAGCSPNCTEYVLLDD